MLKPTGLDRLALRRLFNQKRTGEDRADFLLAEVERRLEERLEPMRLDHVRTLLDLGCGLGRTMPMLARRFPEASVLALDMAEQPLIERRALDVRARRGLRGLLSRIRARGEEASHGITPPRWIAADAHRLPLAANSVEVIWSNLVFHWFDDPLAVIKECYRVLKPNGLLIFSAYGVDTCRELRAASPDSSAENRLVPGGAASGQWPSLQDMHDWGDALMENGFAEPVMETEHLRLSYQSLGGLQADLAAFGFPPVAQAHLPELTIELVIGHAWVPEHKARADGLSPVHIVRKGKMRG